MTPFDRSYTTSYDCLSVWHYIALFVPFSRYAMSYKLSIVTTPCPEKKVPLIFLLILLQLLTDFHNFSCTTSQENAKVIGVKIYYHTLVMLLPYRVKVSDTKVTHFTPICLYRSHLGQPVSTKQILSLRLSAVFCLLRRYWFP